LQQSGFAARNTRYNVTQFYTAMLNPIKTPANEEFWQELRIMVHGGCMVRHRLIIS
jgi:hypothetical protein